MIRSNVIPFGSLKLNFKVSTKPTISLTPEMMTSVRDVVLWRDIFRVLRLEIYNICPKMKVLHLLQNYGCVHVHALYRDIVEYGLIESDNHKHPQSLAEELLVRIPCTDF